MKWFLFLFLAITVIACRDKKRQIKKEQNVLLDSIATHPSVRYSEPDTVYWQRNGESVWQSRKDFRSIKPVRIFISDSIGSAYDKMIEAFIDTTEVVSWQPAFSERITHTDNANRGRFVTQYLYKYDSYSIKIIEAETEDARTVRLFINGQELKQGKDINTPKDHSGFSDDIRFDPSSFTILKVPGKEYLYFRGDLYKCNGIGCGISYHLLYDPVTRKAMVVDQFRIQKFLIGYDKNSRSPVFMLMDETELAPPGYALDHEGSAYIFSRTGKVLPAKGRDGKQYYVKGYGWDTYFDTLYIVEGRFPVKDK